MRRAPPTLKVWRPRGLHRPDARTSSVVRLPSPLREEVRIERARELLQEARKARGFEVIRKGWTIPTWGARGDR